MGKRFQRRIEDFTCEQCGERVTGDGYTNHCPHCLWSRHVDNQPGDREAECGGMMEPVQLLHVGGRLQLRHRCVRCGVERVNRVSTHDQVDKFWHLLNAPGKID